MFKRSLSNLFLSALVLLLIVGRLCAAGEGATLATDEHKYEQGQTMTITGAGFTAGATISMTVARPDKVVEAIPGVRADSNGGFIARYVAPGINGSYLITASDGVHTADTRAADPFVGSVANYSQCANNLGLGFSVSDPDPGCHWINGDLNHNNSKYIEGDATVQRALIITTPGQPHSVTFQYDTTKSGAHAYDFLVDDKFSEYWVSNTDMCDGMDKLGFPSCGTLTPNAFPIPSTNSSTGNSETPSVEAPYAAKRNMRIRGGTITAIDQPTLASGSFSGDSDMEITVHFTVDNAGADCDTDSKGVTTCPVLITFGAHISRKADWKGKTQTATASTISGSPYHVALVAVDESSVGQRDNQMQANTIDAGLTLVKVVKDDSVNGGTAAPSLWTLSAAGPQPGTTGSFSGPGNSDLVTQVALPPGTYLLSESGGPASGYTNGTSWTCDKNGDGALSGLTSITLASTDSAICTIENTRDIGTIELKKHWAGAAGATTLSIGTSAGGSNIASQSVNGADGGTGAKKVAAGAYYVSETAVSGYDATLTCTDDGAPITPGAGNAVSVTKGHNVVCTFTNTQKGTVVVVKNTVGGDGTFDFTASPTGKGIDAAFSLTTSALTATKTFNQVSAGGPYSITETAQSGWIPTSATCTSGTPSSFTLTPGGSVTCTFTNEKAGHLIVSKVTVPSGDTTVFAITASGTGTISGGGAATVSTAASKDYQVSAGTYAVAETPQAGWDETANTCSGIAIAAGESKSCTITNTKRGHLIVQKTTLPGGDATVFSISASGSGAITGGGAGTVTDALNKDYEVTPGTYSVAETVPSGWDKTGDDCQGVTVAAGETKYCTITNTKRGHLIVQKTTLPAGDPTVFSITASGSGVITGGGAGTITDALNKDYEVTPGTYSVAETVPSGWDKTGDDCQGIAVAAGETKYCTITNTKRGHLIVQKTTLPAGDPTVFSILASGGGTITGGGSGTITDALNKDYEVTPGTYSVAETVPSGWDKTGDTCQNVVVNPGETKYCLITNTKRGSINVIKYTVGGDGSFGFTSNFGVSSISTTGGSGHQQVDNLTTLNTYSISETPQTGWLAGSFSCNHGTAAAIVVLPGQVTTCEITNRKLATLTIIKQSKGEIGQFGFAVGGDITLTPSITTSSIPGTQNGTGQWFTLLNGGSYTVDETSMPNGWTLTDAGCNLPGGSAVGSDTNSDGILDHWALTLQWGGNATCTFVNQAPTTTRTQGFWATHTVLADAVWNGGPGMPSTGTPVAGGPDALLCTEQPITAVATVGGNQLMGGFWANIAQLSDPALKGKAGQRKDLDKARMQMLQQYLAAVLNVHAFGSGNPALLSDARAAYCSTEGTESQRIQAIQNQIGILGTFNTSGDDLPFTPGASATPTLSRQYADIDFWDQTIR